ncbi:MAG: phosphopeptide-binding protein, partial [Microbacteriaceae bacterium]|nr:phosphopeptide-binding protein [Microbacteriaceae bacterium]
LGPNDQQRLVAAIAGAAASAAVPRPRRPWLDELPAIVDPARLWTRDDARIPFGLSDDPAQQRRVEACFLPDVDGHIAFIGTGGSGKSVALRTLALATAVTPEGGPVQVYALDFASGGLRMLEGLPHVGAVIPGEDTERVQRLLRRLRRELADRAERYSAASAASIAEYRRNAERPDEPRILLLIDGFPAFREEWDLTLGRAAWYDVFKDVLGGGRQLGIHVALTADRPGAVPSGVASVVRRRVVLRLTEDAAYSALGAPKDVLDDASPPGRCLVDGLETQIAVFGAQATVSTAADQAGALAAYVEAQPAIPVAPPIESLPALVPAAQMPARIAGRPVLGISDETLALTGFDPSGAFLLSGPPLGGRSNALAWLVESLHRFDPALELVYLGNARSGLPAALPWASTAVHLDDVAALAKELSARISAASAEGDGGGRLAIVIESVGEFIQTPADQALAELVRQAKRHGHFVLGESEVAGWGGSWPLLAEFKNARRGLLLQPDPMEGDLLLKTAIPRTTRTEFPPGRGVYVERGRAARVQIPLTSSAEPPSFHIP